MKPPIRPESHFASGALLTHATWKLSFGGCGPRSIHAIWQPRRHLTIVVPWGAVKEISKSGLEVWARPDIQPSPINAAAIIIFSGMRFMGHAPYGVHSSPAFHLPLSSIQTR